MDNIRNCLYFGKDKNLTFKSEEHIIPSFLGGSKRLEKGIVSDQANKYFSPMEEIFSHDPIISFLRSFFGPGKRETTKPKDLFDLSGIPPTLSKDVNGYFLAIIANGFHTYDIPQIKVSKNKIQVIPSPYSKKFSDRESLYQWIFRNDFSTLRFQKIINNELDDQVIFGIFKNRVYYASNKELKKDELLEVQDLIKESYKNQNIETPYIFDIINPVRNLISFRYSDEVNSKVLSKIAVNYLCKLKGKEFVQKNCKEILEYITNKNYWNSRFIANRIVGLPLNPNLLNNEHFIQLQIIDNRIIASLGFYNIVLYILDLGECNFKEPLDLPIFICNFKKHNDDKISFEEFTKNF